MPNFASTLSFLSRSFTGKLNSPAIPAPEEHEIWFDSLDYVYTGDFWFDAKDRFPDENISAMEYADTRVPISEDLYRCAKKIIIIFANFKQSELFSQLFAELFPGIPFNILMAVNDLCDAIINKKHIDSLVLQTLSLVSWYLPEDINIISKLAAFIRETIINWTGASFLRDSRDGNEDHQDHLYMALAVAAVVTSYFITDPGAPQRAVLRIPVFTANLLLRARYYWKALGAMVQKVILPEETARLPAFEVDSSIETTSYAGEAEGFTLAGGEPKRVITGLTSNSTATAAAYTKATVENQRTKTPGVVVNLAEKANAWAIQQLMRESRLSDIFYCTIRKTETSQQLDGRELTYTYFNTQCEAIQFPAPLHQGADDIHEHTMEQETVARSPATRPCAYPLLPVVPIVAATTTYTTALKSKTMVVAATAAGLGTVAGIAIALTHFASERLKKLLDKVLSAPDEKDNLSLPAEALPHRQHILTVKQKVNRRLAKKMIKAGMLDKYQAFHTLRLEEIIAAVGMTLFSPYPADIYGVTEFDKRLEVVAKIILRAQNFYGGRSNEEISFARAGMVVRNWLFDNVLNMPVESWLAGKLAGSKYPEQFSADAMRAMLELKALCSAKVLNVEALTHWQQGQFEAFWNYALDNTVPFRNVLKTDALKSMNAMDEGFVWLSSGTLLLKDMGVQLDDLSAEDYQMVGKALWVMADSGDIPSSYLRYFILPAMLFGAISQPANASGPESSQYINRVMAVKVYADYLKDTAPVYADFRSKVDAFTQAIKEWKTRGKIADKYAEQCPEDILRLLGRISLKSANYPIGEIGPSMQSLEHFTPDKEINAGKDAVRQAYLNGITPLKCKPADVTSEFASQTMRLADTFSAVDEYLLAVAMAELYESELNFINSDGAVIKEVSPQLINSVIKQHWERAIKELKKTDVYSVVVGKEERIYAVIEKINNGYQIVRVDREVGEYIKHDLFDFKAKGIIEVLNDNSILVYDDFTCTNSESYTLIFNNRENTLKEEGVPSHKVVLYYKSKHKNDFYRHLWSEGYTKTSADKTWDVVKHFIPFYDCATDEFPSNVVSCFFDILGLVPFVGEAISLGGKFSKSLYAAIKSGTFVLVLRDLSRNTAKTAVTEAVKKISLPTVKELASLSKTAIQGLDPGFELLSLTTKYSGSGLSAIFTQLMKGMSALDIKNMREILHKINKSGVIETVLPRKNLPRDMAYLPDAENIKVPVQYVRKEGRKKLYTIVDPDTKEALEWVYTIKKGKLKPVFKKPRKRKDKTDIKTVKKVHPSDVKKQTAPGGDPVKEAALSASCPKRIKRGIDELCNSRPYEQVDKNINSWIVRLTEGPALISRLSILKVINPVRYEIIQTCLDNVYRTVEAADKLIKNMSYYDLKIAFKMYTRISITTDQQLITLRENLSKMINAVRFFWATSPTHIFIMSCPSIPHTTAAFDHNAQAMYVSNVLFNLRNPAHAEKIFMHECSHGGANTGDFWYYPPYPSTSIIEDSRRANVDVSTQYNNFIAGKLEPDPLENMVVGPDFVRKFGPPVDTGQAKALGIRQALLLNNVEVADLAVANADTLADFLQRFVHASGRNVRVNVDDLFLDPQSLVDFPSLPNN
ncbi:hypothetical protein [Erwinia pyrifoliae]|uniref:Uncharacterized protein n=1 Tax=Erwinia pyrifoliae TaxID=79967 RepID=A0ABY5X7R6_ERWPY|nr:hypothetical protein [Erwinia pyrifoliae]UWS33434.1 hypothetical protein NYP84_17975 [Erwinia pyrifoliae]